MGATITCTSSTNGTTFIIRNILLERTQLSELDTDRVIPRFWTPETAKRIHLLLAEDNKLNQIVLKKLVNQCGFQFTMVNNGQECVDTWKEAPEKYSMIFMDLQVITNNKNENNKHQNKTKQYKTKHTNKNKNKTKQTRKQNKTNTKTKQNKNKTKQTNKQIDAGKRWF